MTANLLVLAGATSLVQHKALDRALHSARDYALAEKSASTMRAYASDWRQFSTWCDGLGLEALPAPIGTVAAYLATLADAGLKASTINRRVAAIAFRHRSAGAAPPTSAEKIKGLLRGIRRTIGTRSEQKAPATAKVVKAFVRTLPDTLAGKRDRALLLLGFAAALRRSELVALAVSDIERAPEGVLLHLRKSKTDQEGKGHVVAVPRGSKLGVLDALEGWLAAADIQAGPVFRAICKGGRVSDHALSGRSVADIVKQRAAAAKLDPAVFSAHSLRAGLVTEALEKNADPFKIMDVTRHKSVDTLKIYDRRAKAFKDHAGAKFL